MGDTRMYSLEQKLDQVVGKKRWNTIDNIDCQVNFMVPVEIDIDCMVAYDG